MKNEWMSFHGSEEFIYTWTWTKFLDDVTAKQLTPNRRLTLHSLPAANGKHRSIPSVDSKTTCIYEMRKARNFNIFWVLSIKTYFSKLVGSTEPKQVCSTFFLNLSLDRNLFLIYVRKTFKHPLSKFHLTSLKKIQTDFQTSGPALDHKVLTT